MTELTELKIELALLAVRMQQLRGELEPDAPVGLRLLERASRQAGAPVSARDIARFEARALARARHAALALSAHAANSTQH